MSRDISQKVDNFFASYPARTFAKGEVVIQAGAEPSGVFYLVEGRANQYDISPTGNSVVVNVFKPHAFFPMSWAINRTPNHYFFESATPITIRQAPADDVVNFLHANPDVLFELLARVYRGTDGVLRRMAHLMGGSAKSRVLFELLNAAYRFGQAQRSAEVIVMLNESDLAKHTGLSRETVSRTLQALKVNGIIEVNRNGLVIKSITQLESLLGSGL